MENGKNKLSNPVLKAKTNPEMTDYSKAPFFGEKAKKDQAFLKKAGLPKAGQKVKSN